MSAASCATKIRVFTPSAQLPAPGRVCKVAGLFIPPTLKEHTTMAAYLIAHVKVKDPAKMQAVRRRYAAKSLKCWRGRTAARPR